MTAKSMLPAGGRHPDSVIVRFWSKVDRSAGDAACWEWQGYRMPLGYGQMNVGGRKGGAHLAHRLAWEITHGAIPPGLEVCHNCPGGDNPSCVNPAHLFLGTHADNMSDMGRKGRAGGPGMPGGLHPSARLTEHDVRVIRARAQSGEVHRLIAADFGLCRSTVSYIVNRRLWSHIA